MVKKIEKHFIWIIAFLSVIALCKPSLFVWLKPYIALLLGIIMFGIGATLKTHELKKTYEFRWTIVVAITVKYIIMPLSAYCIGLLLKLPLLEILGLVIIGASPGGTAANVMAYLAKANTVLTVVLTFATTIIAPLVTPAIVYLLMNQHIGIPFGGMAKSLLLIIALPIIAGMLIKKSFEKKVDQIAPIFPTISIISIALAIACIVSLSRPKILSFPLMAIIAVTLLNLIGYLTGFITSVILGNKTPEKKSLCFEFGMFDTGLALVIAATFFGPLAALPAALLSFIQNLTASVLVHLSRRHKMQHIDTPPIKHPAGT